MVNVGEREITLSEYADNKVKDLIPREYRKVSFTETDNQFYKDCFHSTMGLVPVCSNFNPLKPTFVKAHDLSKDPEGILNKSISNNVTRRISLCTFKLQKGVTPSMQSGQIMRIGGIGVEIKDMNNCTISTSCYADDILHKIERKELDVPMPTYVIRGIRTVFVFMFDTPLFVPQDDKKKRNALLSLLDKMAHCYAEKISDVKAGYYAVPLSVNDWIPAPGSYVPCYIEELVNKEDFFLPGEKIYTKEVEEYIAKEEAKLDAARKAGEIGDVEESIIKKTEQQTKRLIKRLPSVKGLFLFSDRDFRFFQYTNAKEAFSQHKNDPVFNEWYAKKYKEYGGMDPYTTRKDLLKCQKLDNVPVAYLVRFRFPGSVNTTEKFGPCYNFTKLVDGILPKLEKCEKIMAAEGTITVTKKGKIRVTSGIHLSVKPGKFKSNIANMLYNRLEFIKKVITYKRVKTKIALEEFWVYANQFYRDSNIAAQKLITLFKSLPAYIQYQEVPFAEVSRIIRKVKYDYPRTHAYFLRRLGFSVSDAINCGFKMQTAEEKQAYQTEYQKKYFKEKKKKRYASKKCSCYQAVMKKDAKKMAAMRKAGKTIKQIAEKMKKSVRTVNRYLAMLDSELAQATA